MALGWPIGVLAGYSEWSSAVSRSRCNEWKSVIKGHCVGVVVRCSEWSSVVSGSECEGIDGTQRIGCSEWSNVVSG